VAVSLHYAGSEGDYPLALRLFLPEAWTADRERLDRARVPSDERAPRAKWRIALDLLDTVRAEGLPHAALVADAGYGMSDFRAELEARGEYYLLGLSGEEVVFSDPPAWVAAQPTSPRGRPPSRAYLAEDAPPPVSVKQWATTLPRTRYSWRTGTKGTPLVADFAWVRVWPAHDWQRGVPIAELGATEERARWLLVEWRTDGTIKYAISNLPADTPMDQAIGWWKERWQVEQGYRQLKRELGLDHFEGRSWTGFHHHATMTLLAYGFLALERRRARQALEGSLGESPHGAPVSPPCVAPSNGFSPRRAGKTVARANGT
jgi:SRSO17 transposase